MQSEFFSEQSVRHLSNEVLLRCVAQFRQAISMLSRSGLTSENVYLQEMQEGLGNMEVELSRRNLLLDAKTDDWIPPYSVYVAPLPPVRP